MASKKKKGQETEKSAVDRLVEASNGDDSGVEAPKEEKKRYGSFLARIPTPIKAIFFKWWFVGACCFFFYWGLANYINHIWDQILVLGLATGAVTDLLTNNLMRLLETSDDEYHAWMLIPLKKWWTIFPNVIYGFLIVTLVVYTYQGINTAVVACNPGAYSDGTVPLPVGPLLFGVFYLAYDLIFIGIKDLIVHLVKNRRQA